MMSSINELKTKSKVLTKDCMRNCLLYSGNMHPDQEFCLYYEKYLTLPVIAKNPALRHAKTCITNLLGSSSTDTIWNERMEFIPLWQGLLNTLRDKTNYKESRFMMEALLYYQPEYQLQALENAFYWNMDIISRQSKKAGTKFPDKEYFKNQGYAVTAYYLYKNCIEYKADLLSTYSKIQFRELNGILLDELERRTMDVLSKKITALTPRYNDYLRLIVNYWKEQGSQSAKNYIERYLDEDILPYIGHEVRAYREHVLRQLNYMEKVYIKCLPKKCQHKVKSGKTLYYLKTAFKI